MKAAKPARTWAIRFPVTVHLAEHPDWRRAEKGRPADLTVFVEAPTREQAVSIVASGLDMMASERAKAWE